MKYTFEFMYHLVMKVRVTIEADCLENALKVLQDLIGNARAKKAQFVDVR